MNNDTTTARTGKRAKFWTRLSLGETEEWRLVKGWDESRVPLKAWKAYNLAFWKQRRNGHFYPLDDLDAYQFGARELIRAAERTPELTNASRSTYLVTVAFRSLLRYRTRRVDPARADYRAICDRAHITDGDETERQSEDRADREWGENTTLDVRAYIEALPGTRATDRLRTQRLTAACVHSTLTKLDADASAGLTAFLRADGVWTEAARLYNPRCPVQSYRYRFTAIWAPAFRKECDWVW